MTPGEAAHSSLHASEYGFWASTPTDTRPASANRRRPSAREIIKESTANGVGNAFHIEWQAESGEGDYIPIFVPWFWQDE